QTHRNETQTYMRGEAGVGSLGRTISRYTFSWSSGIGFGFLFGGLFKSGGGAMALSAASIIFCLAILALAITHSQNDHENDSADGRIETMASFHPDDEAANSRALALHWRYVVIGWSICFGCNFGMRPISTFIPKFLAEQGHPAWLAGGMLFSLYVMQALIGSQAYKFRSWQYRKTPLLVQQGLLLLCFIGLWSISNLFATAIILMVLGLLFGVSFFWSVYYVSNHPRSSRNVGVNEALVGVANICGVLASQDVITYYHSDAAYYLMVALVLAFLMFAQWLWLRPRKISAHGM
ncbi:MAG: MFS transporter, partial [Abditibacteriaceae bacterium]